MFDRVGLKSALESFVTSQWNNYRSIRDSTLPDITIVSFSPKGEELSVPFPIVTIMPEKMQKEKSIGRIAERENTFSITMFNLGTYNSIEADLLMHFANAIILGTPKKITATLFNFETQQNQDRTVTVMITDETYNLKGYGEDTILFSAELTASLIL